MHSVTICDDQSRIVSVIARNTLIFPGACCELHYINVSNPCFNFASQLTNYRARLMLLRRYSNGMRTLKILWLPKKKKFKL